ncbi:MAG: DNA polymerase, partial [Methanothrix sp.]
MKAVTHMEHRGIPIDVEASEALGFSWARIQGALIEDIDKDYGVFDGQTFKHDLWEKFIIENSIPWPRLESGRLDLSDDVFREIAKSHPQVAPIRELRVSLSQMRLSGLAVGGDRRNRCLLSPFSAKTSRNQPSNSKYIFGPSKWLRGLIKPGQGMGIASVDWEQQEFGIAAALSGDMLMMRAYQSGDPYLAFAKQAGALPEGASKESHGVERDKFKACVLAVQYGMGYRSLAQRIGCLECESRELLRLHQTTYKRFWQWSDGVANHAELHRELWTVFGWHIQYPGDINPRSTRNFPMQANGAEMLRLAC